MSFIFNRNFFSADSKTVNDENDSQNNATLKTSANYLSPTKKKALAESTAINSSPLILSKTVSPDETENLMSLGFLTEFQKEFNLTTFLKAKESAGKVLSFNNLKKQILNANRLPRF